MQRLPQQLTCRVHDYAEARKACKEGEVPVLAFAGGGKHVLLPTGQHLRMHPKDTDLSPRQRRKYAKEQRRIEAAVKAEISAPPPEAPVPSA